MVPDDDQALIGNGMIYNYQELKDGLPARDFATDSDSETILHGYRKWGSDVVNRLDGMFAFVMTDGDRLLAARDPIGIKPLYMGRIDGALAFSSEVAALAGIADDIQEFPAGRLYVVRSGHCTT